MKIVVRLKISLKFIPKGPINNKPALVPIVAWRQTGNKPLSEPMMVDLLMHICITRLQWVNILIYELVYDMRWVDILLHVLNFQNVYLTNLDTYFMGYSILLNGLDWFMS